MTSGDRETRAEVTRGGDISPEQLAAIVGAIEATIGRAPTPPQLAGAPRWRFSGRWWSMPVPLRRSRPWYH